MAIKKFSKDAQEICFKRSVLKIETSIENRNCSDTLDYSDWRDITCTWALVYLGKYGVAPQQPRVPGHRVTMYLNDKENTSFASNERPLAVHERFAWIDCTNTFSDRTATFLHPEADNFSDIILEHGCDVFDEFDLFKAHHEAARQQHIAAEEQRQCALLEVKKQQDEKKAVRKAANDVKAEATRAAAELLLKQCPKKGSRIATANITGTVFWTGITKFRGAYSARVGVKDARGAVTWISAEKFC